ncbi:MAG: T9SS type A sorting domain-containing protein [Flavobacteriales bacterium]
MKSYGLFVFALLSLTGNAQLISFFERSYDYPSVSHNGQLANPWAGGLNSVQVSTADFNEDGREDLFVFDRISARVNIFINESTQPGESKYRYTLQYNSAFPSTLKNWAFMRDFNCDGKKDICSNSQSGMLVWYNTTVSGGELAFTPANGGNLIQANYAIGNNPFDAPLYTISVDIPSFVDYDEDGDIDIFSFSEQSTTMYYFKSMQVENGTCDELDYICANRCYGMFNESPESFDIFYGDNFSCNLNVNNPRTNDISSNGENTFRHTGGTILSLDLDNNGVKDLVLGDVTEPNLVSLLMVDTEGGIDSAITFNNDFPFSSGGAAPAVNMTLFPGAFYEDVTNDGVKDLLVSPNANASALDHKSLWLYKNNGTNTSPVFEFVTDAFLQEGMIDWGLGATPAIEDVNGDGLIDLIVANRVQYDPANQFTSRLYLYENIGEAFQLVDSNWVDILSLQLKSVHPSFGDIDSDGDKDLILGDQDGFVRVFENDNGYQSPPVQLLDNTGALLDVGQFATPQLFDLNQDGLLDLLVGEKEGNVNYYKNIGTASVANFQLIEDTLADIVAPNYLGIFGYSVPHFVYVPDVTTLFLGTETGVVQVYTIDVLGNDQFAASLPDESMIKREGDRSSVALGDFNNDNFLDLVMGQVGGGLAFFLDIWEGTEEFGKQATLQAYPNPSTHEWNVLIENADATGEFTLYDINGRQLLRKKANQRITTFSNEDLPIGVYILQFTDSNSAVTTRLIKQ